MPLLEILEKALLVTLVVATMLIVIHMFDEEEFSPVDALKDVVTAAIAFALFFWVSGNTITLWQAVLALGGGMVVGLLVSFPVKLQRKKLQWHSKGSLLFLGVWAVVFTLSQVSEIVFVEVSWWWLALALFGLAMNVGGVVGLWMRQKML